MAAHKYVIVERGHDSAIDRSRYSRCRRRQFWDATDMERPAAYQLSDHIADRAIAPACARVAAVVLALP